ncbi:hypothetical protein ALC57_09416 [Trachymyrmex cornetzi]|uniref:Uncharacterized protein n=1 Tax=Trachymyrmex cornetzi TaxID=471704 RepID=A0A195E0A4_9HYME|nr:hypothetical protein ALC57_09416 [Trachymyrmex cornetzi]
MTNHTRTRAKVKRSGPTLSLYSTLSYIHIRARYPAYNHWTKKRRKTCIKISRDSRYVRVGVCENGSSERALVRTHTRIALIPSRDAGFDRNNKVECLNVLYIPDRAERNYPRLDLEMLNSLTTHGARHSACQLPAHFGLTAWSPETVSRRLSRSYDSQHFIHTDYLLPYFPQLLAALLFNAINLQPVFIRHSLDRVLIAQLKAQLASGVTSFQIGGQVILQNFPQFRGCKCSLQRSSSSNHDLYHLAVHCTNQQNAGLILHCLSVHQVVDINIDAKSNIAQEFNTWIGRDFVKCIEDVLHILMIRSNPIAY